MYLVQLVPGMWNVIIAQVRKKQQILPTSISQRLDAHNRDVRRRIPDRRLHAA
jgi:hypothetical protein